MPDDSILIPLEAQTAVDASAGLSPAWAEDDSRSPSPSQKALNRAIWATERRLIEQNHAPGSDALSFKRRAATAASVWIEAAMELSGLGAIGRRNAKAITLTTQTLSYPSLPDTLDGFRILFVSDPHFDAMDGFADALVNRVEGLQCDLLVMGGDYRFGHGGAFVEHDTMAALGRVRDAVNVSVGSYAILGNHDCADMAAGIEQAGFRLLVNETLVARVGDASIAVTGLDDVYAYSTQAATDALARGPLVPADFSLALVHSPELADEAAAAGHDLYLCGHTHGGQVCLPGGKYLVMPLHRNHDLAIGRWRKGAMHGYTSRGAGTSGLPYRFNCPPEVVALTLKKA